MWGMCGGKAGNAGPATAAAPAAAARPHTPVMNSTICNRCVSRDTKGSSQCRKSGTWRQQRQSNGGGRDGHRRAASKAHGRWWRASCQVRERRVHAASGRLQPAASPNTACSCCLKDVVPPPPTHTQPSTRTRSRTHRHTRRTHLCQQRLEELARGVLVQRLGQLTQEVHTVMAWGRLQGGGQRGGD